MKIYEMKIAPNPRRVRIFLYEKGITDVEFVQMDLQGGDNLSEAFRKKSPLAKVPVLELDDGTCISETVAICRYFEETHPEKPLMGSSPLEKAQIEMWHRLAEFYLFVPTGMCFQHTSGYFKDRMTPIPEWGEQCRSQVESFLDFLDSHLADQAYLAGDRFSLADITALTAVDFNKVNRIRPKETQPHLTRWYQEMCARPSYQA